MSIIELFAKYDRTSLQHLQRPPWGQKKVADMEGWPSGEVGVSYDANSKGVEDVYCATLYLPTFLRYKREIFILGVLGFLNTTRSFPKSSVDVRSLPKAKLSRKRLSTKSEIARKILSFTHFCTLFSFLAWI